jgi:hypothetical protein
MRPGFAAQTHDFESRYLDGLIGMAGGSFRGWPGSATAPQTRCGCRVRDAMSRLSKAAIGAPSSAKIPDIALRAGQGDRSGQGSYRVLFLAAGRQGQRSHPAGLDDTGRAVLSDRLHHRYHRPLQGQRERAYVSFASGNLFVAGWPDDDSQP